MGIHLYPSYSFIHRNLSGVRRRVHRWWVPNGQAQRSAWTSTWRSLRKNPRELDSVTPRNRCSGKLSRKKNGIIGGFNGNLCSWQQSVRGIRKTQWIHIIDIRLYYSWCIISLIASYCNIDQYSIDTWPKRCHCAKNSLSLSILQKLKENKFNFFDITVHKNNIE